MVMYVNSLQVIVSKAKPSLWLNKYSFSFDYKKIMLSTLTGVAQCIECHPAD